jgi:hypothetical protein
MIPQYINVYITVAAAAIIITEKTASLFITTFTSMIESEITRNASAAGPIYCEKQIS